MDPKKTAALANLDPENSESVEHVLRESGYGALADEWISSRQDFEEQSLDTHGGPVKPEMLAAFARMRMCWFRVSQLKEQARSLLGRRDNQ